MCYPLPYDSIIRSRGAGVERSRDDHRPADHAERSLRLPIRQQEILAGLPADFHPTTSKRLGTRLVNALAKQLGAELTRPSSTKGTNFTLLVPLEPAAAD
jgi:hypothetical protein